MKSSYTCPACEKPLKLTYAPLRRVMLYCPHGSCESFAANQEHVGETEQEAFKKLERAVEVEIEKKQWKE